MRAMKLAIEDGVIKPTLNKTQRKYLDEAENLAAFMSQLSPTKQEINDAADAVLAGVKVLRQHCVKVEVVGQPELPIMKEDPAASSTSEEEVVQLTEEQVVNSL